MKEHIVKIISIQPVTHNVNRYTVEKPKAYKFEPGQATEVSINNEKWRDEKRPFTFTCLNDEDHLEFTIKSYTDHDGVTNQLSKLTAGDELIIRDVWGTINYKGPGYFIAGGAGITPFIAILRQLYKDDDLGESILFFSNKTDEDIILKDELVKMLGDKVKFTVTQQKDSIYDHRKINASFLKSEITDLSKNFYVCGPDEMVKEITEDLKKMGAKADTVVFEK